MNTSSTPVLSLCLWQCPPLTATSVLPKPALPLLKSPPRKLTCFHHSLVYDSYSFIKVESRNHDLYTFSGFTILQNNSFESHSRVYVFIPFYCRVVFHCVAIPYLCICSPIGRYLVCLQFLATTNKVALNLYIEHFS